VQKVIWEGRGTKPAGEYTFSCGKGNENYEPDKGSFVHNRIMSAVKAVELVSDRKSHINTEGSLGSYYCSECSYPNTG
jgi:hypothetical protein